MLRARVQQAAGMQPARIAVPPRAERLRHRRVTGLSQAAQTLIRTPLMARHLAQLKVPHPRMLTAARARRKASTRTTIVELLRPLARPTRTLAKPAQPDLRRRMVRTPTVHMARAVMRARRRPVRVGARAGHRLRMMRPQMHTVNQPLPQRSAVTTRLATTAATTGTRLAAVLMAAAHTGTSTPLPPRCLRLSSRIRPRLPPAVIAREVPPEIRSSGPASV